MAKTFKRSTRRRRGRGLTTKVARLTTQVKSIIKGMEVKYVDNTTTDNLTMNFTGTVLNISQVAQGTDVDQRLGNKITLKSLYFRGYVVGNATNQYNIMRVLIVLDTANQGSDPASSDILQTTGDNLVTASPLNKDKMPRFRILYDKVFTAQNTGQQVHQLKYFKKFPKGINLDYTGTGATTPYKKALYVVYCSDVNTNDPTFNFYSRIGYTDS